ncbi:MAG: hypothetical protein KDJ31_00205, partial [Candidatus Competibacteraceae bacterium]|nr:hypothetical protein [Candidatus Competibacteraceae bacterium]
MGLHTPERQGSGRAHRRATIQHPSRLLAAKDPHELSRIVARTLRRYAKLARIGRTLGTLPLLGLSLLAASPVSAEQSSSPVAVLSADNDQLTTQIAVLIGAHNFALPLSFVPDPIVGIPAQAVTFGTNLGLKNVQAVFNTPSDWESSPNSTDQCTYDFDLPRSAASYSNLLGLVNTQSVPEQWGDLTRFGPPVQVAHANTDVEVSVVNAHIVPDQQTTQRVSLPAGRHTLTWRAETQISDLFDIIIPAAFLGFNVGYYGAAFADQGASAARQAARQDAAREVMLNIALEAGLITADQLTDTGRTTVTHERTQEITIY